MATIPVRALQAGMTFAHDLHGPDGQLLLASGTKLTESVLSALTETGVEALTFAKADDRPVSERAEDWRRLEHERDIARARAALRKAAEGVIAARMPRWNRLSLTGRPEAGLDRSTEHESDLELDFDVLAQESRERLGLVERMFHRLIDGHGVGASAPIALVNELIETARTSSLQCQMLAWPEEGRDQSLAAQAYATAGLAVLCALRMGWGSKDVRAAGLAGLFADCGMALLPHDVRHQAREMTDVEINALHRHTAYSATLLELVKGDSPASAIPEAVQLAVYQHHERLDASGYPGRVRGSQIHDLAKLVGVVTTFVGLASERAHRPALGSQAALREVARAANEGSLDARMVRALIASVGVYPAGSRVKLSTGHIAVVVGPSAGGRVDRPVVRVLAGSDSGRQIDLGRYARSDVAVIGMAA